MFYSGYNVERKKERMIMMESRYEVIKDDAVLYEGIASDVREWIEDALMASELGFSPMLQESEEDEEELAIYLHTEYGDDLSDKEIEKVAQYGFNEHDSLPAIYEILKIVIKKK